MNKIIIQFLFFLLLLPTNILAKTLQGKVIHVADGDTITILTPQKKQVKIRLAAIDCPESGQAYGKKAKKFTSSMVYGKHVKVKPITKDRYGRTVAMVLVNSSNLSKQIIANGYGWVFRKYCKWRFCDDWLRLEEKVRDRGIGLWRDRNAIPPWEWRKAKRNGGSNKKNNVVGGLGIYHGNARSKSLHGYGCKYYNCKNCTVVFRSVSDAVNAGYHPHNECVK